jgi:hypothetical protein
LDALSNLFKQALDAPATNAAPVAPAPQVGGVMSGYQFQGGDQRDQNNWEPAARFWATRPIRATKTVVNERGEPVGQPETKMVGMHPISKDQFASPAAAASPPAAVQDPNNLMAALYRLLTAAPTAPPSPKIGDVTNGYRFKGGNPAVPENWELTAP